ncbi:MAG: flavodoxin [Candidatus Omnitrophica bacterium]|nr:flavodoxin [Candidatus Omnitrophota bacterium]MDD5436367.1 flavodoxin [Candidatus Omnitrophota bacterium]
MKILVTYYSFSGNTDKIAKMFGKILESKGEVHLQRLKPVNEIKGFIGQCAAARKKEKAILEQGVRFDASSYDLVLIGSPVWAFAPTPAMNTFLENLSGLKGKRVIVLLTSGSGLGVKACFNNIEKALGAKGAGRIDRINIPDRRNQDNDFVASSLQKVL